MKISLVRRWLLISGALLLSTYTFAQFGTQAIFYQPIRDLGYAYKSGVGFELNYQDEVTDRILGSFGIGFIPLAPRQVPHNGYFFFGESQNGGAGSLIPQATYHSFYKLYTIRIGLDYLLFDAPFTPTLGINIIAQAGEYQTSDELETANARNGSDNEHNGISAQPNIGFLYEITDDWYLNGKFGRGWTIHGQQGPPTHYWRSELGVSYLF